MKTLCSKQIPSKNIILTKKITIGRQINCGKIKDGNVKSK